MKSLLPIILIIVSVGLFFFQVTPLYSDVQALRADSAQYDDALAMADELKQLRGDLTVKLASFPQADLDKLDHFLPRHLDTVRIILDVDGIATRNGIKIKNPKIDDASAGDTSKSKAPYNTVSIGFTFTSSYPQAMNFIQDIQSSLRLLDPSALSIKTATAEGSAGLYDFNMSLDTYWINR